MKFLFALLLALTFCHADINVACAANMQFAMKEIIDAYEKETGKSVKPIFGSSGKLSAQILNGAPFDVFVSADMNYVDRLYKTGATKNPPKEYAKGKLALWTMKDLDLSKGVEVLKDSTLRRVAVGDPKVTVYGPAAIEVLEKIGVLKVVQSKLVYGENISTVAQYIVSASVDIGFSNLSFTQSGPLAGKGKYIVLDSSLHSPLLQGAAILRHGMEKKPEESEQFFAYLFGKKARAILSRYGYGLP